MYDETDSLTAALTEWLDWLTHQGARLSPAVRAEAVRLLREIEAAIAAGDTPLAARLLYTFAQTYGVPHPDTREVYRGENPRGYDRFPFARPAADLKSLITRIDQALTGRLSPPAASPPPAIAPITTYPEVRAPAEAPLRTRFPVHVAARAQATADSAGKLTIPRERPGPVDLEVSIELPDSALEPAESGTPLEQPLRVHESGSSAEITFELFAVAEGAPRFDVVFRQGGTERMRVERRVVVAPVQTPPNDIDTALVRSPAGAVALGARFEGLVLRIEQRGVGNDVRIIRATLSGPAWKGAPLVNRAELPLLVWRKIADVCRQLPDATLRDPGAAESRLENIGVRLGEQLLGPEILRALAGLADNASLHIESDDAWVPWELVCVRTAATGTFFLGERLAVTRWLQVGRALDVLPVARPVLVAPRTAGLNADPERRALTALLGPPEELARVGEVQGLLAAAPRSVIHFVCHGASLPDAPFPDRLKLDDGDLQVVDVPRAAPGEIGALDGGLVFANACQAEIATPSIWGVGGWAEAFLLAGVGAFLAPSWSVRDSSASMFARSFYDHATRVPLGEAARLARCATRAVGVPCRLAYAVYCSPNARLAPTPRGTAG